MLKDIKSMENFFYEINKTELITNEQLEFFKNKIRSIKDAWNEMELKVQKTEQKEKLGTEKQKVFGNSQTKVEESRHKNILEEINLLKEAGITNFNRSSYPFYPRHKNQKKK